MLSNSAIITSCRENNYIPTIETTVLPDNDGIIRDISAKYRSELSQDIKRKILSSLKLNNLENGFNGLEIRIWEAESLTYLNRLLIIRNSKSTWVGELYYFRDSFGKKYEGATAVEKINIELKSAEWQDVVNALFSMKIDKIRDASQIPGLESTLASHESGVLVEIAQNNFYKAYQHPTLGGIERDKRFKEVKLVRLITNFIDSKFGNKIKDSTYGG